MRVRFLRVPVRWELREVRNEAQGISSIWAFPTLDDDGTLDTLKLKERDAWDCREEFLSIPYGDNERMRLFLESVGLWLDDRNEYEDQLSEVAQHRRAGHPHPVAISGLWKCQSAFKRSLIDPRAFKEKFGAALGRPETLRELLNESNTVMEFPLSMELGKAATGVIPLDDAFRMLLATVFIDAVRGIRFKVCARKDCRKPFPLESKHKKKFCCWYCAHITTVRRNRPGTGTKKRPRKS
jgi:hypothetical protein